MIQPHPLQVVLHTALPDTAVPPSWVHLVPIGTFRGVDGRGPYRIADPDQVISASMAGGPLPIDENHAIDLAMTTGQPSPARGLITALEMRKDGLWGRVEWNAAGAALLSEKAYRGFSPVFTHDKSGVVRRLLRAALTNTPNLPQLHTLHSQEPEMDLNQLRAALGLPETADAAACMAAVTTLTAQVATHGQQLAGIAAVVGLQSSATAPELVTALQAQRTAAVAPETVVALQTELATMKADRAKEKAEAFVDGAIKAGRPINPTRDFWIARHMAEPAETEKAINAIPSIKGGDQQPAKHAQSDFDGDELNETDREVVARMGLDPKKFAANKKGVLTRGAVEAQPARRDEGAKA